MVKNDKNRSLEFPARKKLSPFHIIQYFWNNYKLLNKYFKINFNYFNKFD